MAWVMRERFDRVSGQKYMTCIMLQYFLDEHIRNARQQSNTTYFRRARRNAALTHAPLWFLMACLVNRTTSPARFLKKPTANGKRRLIFLQIHPVCCVCLALHCPAVSVRYWTVLLGLSCCICQILDCPAVSVRYWTVLLCLSDIGLPCCVCQILYCPAVFVR